MSTFVSTRLIGHMKYGDGYEGHLIVIFECSRVRNRRPPPYMMDTVTLPILAHFLTQPTRPPEARERPPPKAFGSWKSLRGHPVRNSCSNNSNINRAVKKSQPRPLLLAIYRSSYTAPPTLLLSFVLEYRSCHCQRDRQHNKTQCLHPRRCFSAFG